jgi:hypothetical protein
MIIFSLILSPIFSFSFSTRVKLLSSNLVSVFYLPFKLNISYLGPYLVRGGLSLHVKRMLEY